MFSPSSAYNTLGPGKAKSSIPNRARSRGYWDSGHTRLPHSTRNKLIKTKCQTTHLELNFENKNKKTPTNSGGSAFPAQGEGCGIIEEMPLSVSGSRSTARTAPGAVRGSRLPRPLPTLPGRPPRPLRGTSFPRAPLTAVEPEEEAM